MVDAVAKKSDLSFVKRIFVVATTFVEENVGTVVVVVVVVDFFGIKATKDVAKNFVVVDVVGVVVEVDAAIVGVGIVVVVVNKFVVVVMVVVVVVECVV